MLTGNIAGLEYSKFLTSNLALLLPTWVTQRRLKYVPLRCPHFWYDLHGIHKVCNNQLVNSEQDILRSLVTFPPPWLLPGIHFFSICHLHCNCSLSSLNWAWPKVNVADSTCAFSSQMGHVFNPERSHCGDSLGSQGVVFYNACLQTDQEWWLPMLNDFLLCNSVGVLGIHVKWSPILGKATELLTITQTNSVETGSFIMTIHLSSSFPLPRSKTRLHSDYSSSSFSSGEVGLGSLPWSAARRCASPQRCGGWTIKPRCAVAWALMEGIPIGSFTHCFLAWTIGRNESGSIDL